MAGAKRNPSRLLLQGDGFRKDSTHPTGSVTAVANAPQRGDPSLIAPLIMLRSSGESWCLCTATACCTAASSNSFSPSAEIAIVQFISLGISRQSINFRGMWTYCCGVNPGTCGGGQV